MSLWLIQNISLFLVSFAVSYFGFRFLYKTRQMPTGSYLKKMLYIPVGKSLTNSQSLGGLVILLGNISLLTVMVLSGLNTYSVVDVLTFSSLIFSSAIVLSYGYLDDCHEIKARYKLLGQFCISFAIGFLSVNIFDNSYSFYVFAAVSFFSMACLNGANLMDGADGISVKVGSSILLYYLTIGYHFQNELIVNISILPLSSLSAFYFFNKYPSKIHLGEIGGAFLGLLYIVLAVMTTSVIQKNENLFYSIAVAFLPLIFPVGELAISSLRRLYFGKRIFSGDHFHLHHLMINHYKISIQATSNYLGLTTLTTVGSHLMISHLYSEYAGVSFLVICSTLMISYLAIGHKIWKQAAQNEKSNFKLNNLLKSKKVEILSVKIIDDLEFSVRKEPIDKDIDDNKVKKVS